MSTQFSRGRRSKFEWLEDRWLLAGDVTAQIVKGNLVIKGDSSDNVIAITSDAAGSVTNTGTDTTVNSSATAATLTGFTGHIKMKMKSGNDDVAGTGVTTNGIEADMGDGNDTLAYVD